MALAFAGQINGKRRVLLTRHNLRVAHNPHAFAFTDIKPNQVTRVQRPAGLHLWLCPIVISQITMVLTPNDSAILLAIAPKNDSVHCPLTNSSYTRILS